MKKMAALVVSFLLLLTACSEKEGESRSDSETSLKTTIFDGQREALQKATEVESLLQSAADKRKLAIEKEIR